MEQTQKSTRLCEEMDERVTVRSTSSALLVCGQHHLLRDSDRSSGLATKRKVASSFAKHGGMRICQENL